MDLLLPPRRQLKYSAGERKRDSWLLLLQRREEQPLWRKDGWTASWAQLNKLEVALSVIKGGCGRGRVTVVLLESGGMLVWA